MTRKCSDGGKELTRSIIFDWLQKLPWCADCWREYLKSYRSANGPQ